MTIIEKLKSGKRHIHTTCFPGTDIKIGLQVLSESELQEAAFETERHFVQASIEVKLLEMAVVYDKEKITQILFRAIVDPSKQNPDKTYKRLFSSVDELRGLFVSQAVKDALVKEYNELQNELSPQPGTMSDDELSLLWDSVKKTPEVLDSLNSNTLRRLLLFSASRA